MMYWQGEPGESGPPGIVGEPGKKVDMNLKFTAYISYHTCHFRIALIINNNDKHY